jgi:hypothetical protein
MEVREEDLEVERSLYCALLLLHISELLSDMVTGAAYRNEGVNGNRGIATASSKVICTCDPHNKCACAAPSTGKGKKKATPTTLPAYSNVTATIFTQHPRDPNVSAERGKVSHLTKTPWS